MNKFKFAFQAFTLFGLFFAFSVIANAQTRTWVSGVGDDLNPCSRTAPCKTFSKAHSVTAANGEINCLDPGGFGTVTITKSITIDCEDTQGAISAAGVSGGIILNAASIDVRIRGVDINGMGTGVNCIRVLGSGTVKLTLEEVVCTGFTTHGISVETSTGSSKIVVLNSTIRNNGGNGINTFVTGTGSTTIAVDSTLLAFNNIGINLGVAATGSVVDSTISNNTTGAQASGSTSILALMDNQITHNTTGVLAGSSATIRIGGNIITGNNIGLSGSNIFTWGANFVDGNPGGNGGNNGAAAVQ
jgi:hypothetical protein